MFKDRAHIVISGKDKKGSICVGWDVGRSLRDDRKLLSAIGCVGTAGLR